MKSYSFESFSNSTYFLTLFVCRIDKLNRFKNSLLINDSLNKIIEIHVLSHVENYKCLHSILDFLNHKQLVYLTFDSVRIKCIKIRKLGLADIVILISVLFLNNSFDYFTLLRRFWIKLRMLPNMMVSMEEVFFSSLTKR